MASYADSVKQSILEICARQDLSESEKCEELQKMTGIINPVLSVQLVYDGKVVTPKDLVEIDLKKELITVVATQLNQTTTETRICSVCGREIGQGEPYTMTVVTGNIVCADCDEGFLVAGDVFLAIE